ncbi:sensor domain-containing protein [Promicromonospora vindobonensis]|uniref:histidine kinase n=1 Tax=Promicromonospora vindobonensis TaxID=195748 RepID=A0ABW5VTU2_9MICO
MSRPDYLAAALRRPGYLVSRWPPRAWLFTFVSALLPGPFAILVFGGLLHAQPLPFLVGALVVLMLSFSPLIARLDRSRVRLIGREPIVDPHVPTDRRGLSRVVFRLREWATWREVAYVLVCIPLGWVGAAVQILTVWSVILVLSLPGRFVGGDDVWAQNPVGVVLAFVGSVLGVPALGYVLGLLAEAQAALARTLLAPRGAELRHQIERLTASRTTLVRSFEGDLRRIERDLHDGAQQKLVTLAVALGSADLDAEDLARSGVDVGRLRGHLDRAHDLAEAALEDLRSTVRAVHPRVLADHGLTAAVHELTSRMPVPVTLASTVEERFDTEVELCAYFVVSEALTNIARHSRAPAAEVRLERDGDVLAVRVHDDGVGGADFRSGTGLVGLRERAEAAQGRLTLSSPAGGPTMVVVLLPARAPRAASTVERPDAVPTVTETF